MDDEADVVNLITIIMTRMGYEITSAGNAAAAVKLLRESPPDLLILDLMLPDISGTDFLRQMRARPEFKALPVIVLSAMVDPVQIKQALEAGANRYVTKMSLATNLLSTVQEVLTGRGRASSS